MGKNYIHSFYILEIVWQLCCPLVQIIFPGENTEDCLAQRSPTSSSCPLDILGHVRCTVPPSRRGLDYIDAHRVDLSLQATYLMA